MEQGDYQEVICRLDSQNEMLKSLQSNILELTKVVNSLVALSSDQKMIEYKQQIDSGNGLDDGMASDSVAYLKPVNNEEDGTKTSFTAPTKPVPESDDESLVPESYERFVYVSYDSMQKNRVEDLRKRNSGYFSMEDVLEDNDENLPPMDDTLDDDEDILKNPESFKKFDTLLDCSDHRFVRMTSSPLERQNGWEENIRKELKNLEENMPEAMFVRVYKSRMDLVRVVIIGPKGTPYHDGLFFFDLYIPGTYPNTPPLVEYHSGGLSIHPLINTSGNVSLVLSMASWPEVEDMWVPQTSNMYDLLVFIKALFNENPIFYGHLLLNNDVYTGHASLVYNEIAYVKSLKTMVYIMNKPPKGYKDMVVGHFRERVHDILIAYKDYTKGLKVGCDIRSLLEGNNDFKGSCSIIFMDHLAECIQPLIAAFNKIGANVAQQFLYLGQQQTQ